MKKIVLFALLTLLLALPALACALNVSGTLQQAARSTPLADIAVNLEAKDGQTQTVRTGGSGEFRFTGVDQGVYRLTVRLPQGQVAAAMSDDNFLLPSNSENVRTNWFELTEDRQVPLRTSRTTAGIKIVAFVDSNENGGHMSTEPVVPGVRVEVYADGFEHLDPIASATTDRRGELSLPGMSPATYRLKAVLPDGYMIGPIGSKINIYYNCFRMNDLGEAWTDPITLEKGTQGMAVGVVTAGSARGLVWLDENANGLRDVGEKGFDQAAVSVVSATQGFERKTAVNEDGSFLFDPLQPGDYSLRVVLPQGYMFASPGSQSLLTFGYSNEDSAPLTVIKEKVTEIGSIGVIPASGVTVHFYLDENANGRRDKQEQPCEGSFDIVVDGASVKTVKASQDGAAAAPVVRSGSFTLNARVPDGQGLIFSVRGSGNDFGLPGASEASALDVTLSLGEQKEFWAGLTRPASVSGMVFADQNGNGQWEPLEGTLPDFTVQAVNPDGEITAETLTDRSGSFRFESLLPGKTVIRFLLRDPYIASPVTRENGGVSCIASQTGDYGETDLLTLRPAQHVSDLKAALFQASTVSGRVLVHEPDGTVSGLEGVTAILIREDGTEYSDYTRDTTRTDGAFLLKGILPGRYTVKYLLPDHALFEDTDLLSVYSDTFTCTDGSETSLPDLFAVRTARVAGSVLMDGQPVSASVTAANAESGQLLIAEADPETGAFDLKLLRPGTYTLTVTLPENLVFGSDTMLVPGLAQSDSSVTMTLGMGEHKTGQQVTAAYPAVITGTVYWDENHSGQFEADEAVQPGLTVSVLDKTGALLHTLTADENGVYLSPALIPDEYLLSVQLDEDCILNDAAQESLTEWRLRTSVSAGETKTAPLGLLRFAELGGQLWSLDGSLGKAGGLNISLYPADEPDLPIAQTVTDEDGYYRFSRLYPGSYRVRAELPEDYAFARAADTTQRQSIILAGDPDGLSEPFPLSMGEKRFDADIGFGARGGIGDFAWLDENGNGMQDIGERGIPGIRLALYQDETLIAETETDVYGHYLFKDLYPGPYTLRVTIYPELKATLHQTEFPLINSILPETEGTVIETTVVIPSGAVTLSDDLGFALVREGAYPDAMDRIPSTDWSNGGRKNR